VRLFVYVGVLLSLAGARRLYAAEQGQKEPAPPPAAPAPEPEPPVPAPPQPRDYFLNAPKRGTWATFDAYTIGLQASVEHRAVIEKDDYAAIVPKLSTLASLGFGEVATHLDARFLFFSFGGTFGARRVWRNYAFPRNIEGTRALRLDLDATERSAPANWLYGEGRMRMVIPVSDNVLAVTGAALRYEDCPDNSFDWFHTTMHDGGLLFRYDVSVLFRSPSFGAVGPSFRVMQLPRNGRQESEVAAGLTFGRRLGLLKENDLLLANVLVRPGDPSFGFQILRLPLYVLIAYRVSVNF
jgi:hypothetical protein